MSSNPPIGQAGPSFQFILLTVLIVTLVSLMGVGVVLWWINAHLPTAQYVSDDVRLASVSLRDSAKVISDKLMDVFVLGCGAIIGLLGGRSAK